MFNFFKKNDNSISGKDFVDIKDESFVLDVREPHEVTDRDRSLFKEYKLIPLGSLESNLDKLDKDVNYYILCRSGMRSKSAAKILDKADIKNTVIKGGILEINRFV